MQPLVIIPTIRANETLLMRCLESVVPARHTLADYGGTFAENCNQAAEGADEDVLVFLNDDTYCHPGWLDSLLTAFQSPTVGIAGSCLLYPNGLIQHAGIYFTSPNDILTANNITSFMRSGPRPAVTGACLAIRRSIFEEAGGFDPGFRNGYEDVDLCLRVIEAGWDIHYQADSVVTHYESQSGPRRWTHVQENIARLNARWSSNLRSKGTSSPQSKQPSSTNSSKLSSSSNSLPPLVALPRLSPEMEKS